MPAETFVPPSSFSFRTLLLLAVGAVAVASSLVALVVLARSSLAIESRSREQAFREMDRIRERFGGEVPCLDRAGSLVPASPSSDDSARTVRMLAWERADARLVRISTPYWVLRVGSWKMAAARLIAPPLEYVTFADLDRCGRGLILDRRTPRGGRVVIWAE